MQIGLRLDNVINMLGRDVGMCGGPLVLLLEGGLNSQSEHKSNEMTAGEMKGEKGSR